MQPTYLDPFVETLGREALTQIQLKKFQIMLDSVLAGNQFYRRKLKEAGIARGADVSTMADFVNLPFTLKDELSRDQVQSPPYGTNLTFERDRYTRIHQTSGTSGEPLRWLDTEEGWRWWTRCWATVYSMVGVTARDRIFFAFSFGPFIGFWSAYNGAQEIGALSVPGGGLSSYQRAQAILDHDITVLVSTPTYALHLADVAVREGIDLGKSNLNISIHAGEPGASLPPMKERIESSLGVRCYDHAGSTEVGAWGAECQVQNGLHMNEGEFICEIIDPATGRPAQEGELVMTNLGRSGMPVLRYRTGDRVRLATDACPCGRSYDRLDGGIIGRIDDVMVVRGINIFPSSIEEIILRFPEIGEFAVDVYRREHLDDLRLQIEVTGDDPSAVANTVARQMRNALGLRLDVQPVAPGTLPRSDSKAKRFKDHRDGGSTTGAEVKSS